MPFVLSLYMYPESADSEGSGAGMAADAHSQRCVRQVQIREMTAHLRLEIGKFLLIHQGGGNADLENALFLKMGKSGIQIFLQRFTHSLESRLHSPCLWLGIQFIPLDGEDRLEVQHSTHDGGRRGNTPALF